MVIVILPVRTESEPPSYGVTRITISLDISLTVGNINQISIKSFKRDGEDANDAKVVKSGVIS